MRLERGAPAICCNNNTRHRDAACRSATDAAVQYSQVRPIEHVHPLLRTLKQLEVVLKEGGAVARHRPLHHRDLSSFEVSGWGGVVPTLCGYP